MIKPTNILVSFESIIDTDMGLMRLIKKDYNTDFFYPGVINNTEDFQHLVLNLRNSPNPLYTIMDVETDEQKEIADDLFRQFKDQEYKKILDLSPPGTINTILSSNMYNQDLFKVTVLCNSQSEVDILKIKDIVFNDILMCNRNEISLKKYQVLAIKDLAELDEFVNLEKKDIYVPDYRFNIKKIKGFKDALLPAHVLEEYAGKNDFNVYSAYTYKEKYQGVYNEEDISNE